MGFEMNFLKLLALTRHGDKKEIKTKHHLKGPNLLLAHPSLSVVLI